MFRGLFKLTWLEIKIFLREPMGAFGSIFSPLGKFDRRVGWLLSLLPVAGVVTALVLGSTGWTLVGLFVVLLSLALWRLAVLERNVAALSGEELQALRKAHDTVDGVLHDLRRSALQGRGKPIYNALPLIRESEEYAGHWQQVTLADLAAIDLDVARLFRTHQGVPASDVSVPPGLDLVATIYGEVACQRVWLADRLAGHEKARKRK